MPSTFVDGFDGSALYVTSRPVVMIVARIAGSASGSPRSIPALERGDAGELLDLLASDEHRAALREVEAATKLHHAGRAFERARVEPAWNVELGVGDLDLAETLRT